MQNISTSRRTVSLSPPPPLYFIVLKNISGYADYLFSHAVSFTPFSALVPNELSAGTAHTNIQLRNVSNV
jgi:hypothetical protein